MVYNKLLIIIFGFSLTLSWAQPRPDQILITYKNYNKTLPAVLNDLSKISGVGFAYSENKLPTDKPIIVDATDEKMGTLLNVILKPYSLTYKIVGDQIVITAIDNPNIKDKIRIYGFVRDRLSGEPLIGVNVFIINSSHGTTTNNRGFYSFVIESQPTRISFSYVGYRSESLDLTSFTDQNLDLTLMPDGQLNEIVIKENTLYSSQKDPSTFQSLSMEVMRASNHLAGEPDVMRYISMMHGISTAAEGVGGLSVRGGSSDQNLILLDGIPIYNSGHAQGVFSVFNGNSIKNTKVYRAGIPARYHGRLSSVIDIHTKDGNYNKWSGDVTLSTIAANATIEGPIINEKLSFIGSFRRTFLDIWIKELSNYINTSSNRTGFTNYYFNDFNTKLNYKVGLGTDIQVHAFHTNDRFENNRLNTSGLSEVSRRNIDQANRLYSAKINHKLSNAFFTHLTAYSTTYNFESFRNMGAESLLNADTLSYFEGSVFNSKLNERALKWDNDWMVSYKNYIKFGGSLINRSFSPNTLVFDENSLPSPSIDVTKGQVNSLVNQDNFNNGEINIYVENEFELMDDIVMNAGLVYSSFVENFRTSQGVFQPRMTIVTGGDLVTFKAGVTHMAQYLHHLNNGGLGFPSDIFMPTSRFLPVQKSWIFNTDFQFNLGNGFLLGFEAYYKALNAINMQREGAFLDVGGSEPWEASVAVGKGHAYGLDTYLEKNIGKLLFNLNYSYAISNREFGAVNKGEVFAFDLNRRHSFKSIVTYRLSNFSEFLLNWSIMSGSPFSRPLNQIIITNGRPTIVFPEKNNALFPTFHRLDVGFSFYNVYKWGKAKFFVGVYNTYNRLNPFYTELVRTENNSNSYELRQLSLLPVLPTLSYSISF